ncbi:hypothetical protein PYW08_015096 [Mythimna loreyi]|uniref:Uncharacterized protein n=1 Tax=Mythimna loreyi TaxID=667449 RepID=A0ACC2R4B5_9NEOP|nr:hypothetical protein PYW08_015096 [Mythimna loreyi]
MPPAPTDDTSAFTVLERDAPPPPRVHVVKPLQHAAPAPAPAPAPPTHTILDPKFSRALDFKLRRLKEKEILQANLRRPTRYRSKNGILTASNPNVSSREQALPINLSQSHPRINIIEPESDKKISPKMDKSPSPARKTRSRNATSNEGDKPRFVTTVRSGQFLLPPPELARILGLETLYPAKERDKIVYSYSSKPKAVAPRSKRSVQGNKENVVPNGAVAEERRSRAGQLFGGVRALVAGVAGMARLLPGVAHHGHVAPADSGSLGTSQYANVMHEKRVVRGSTITSHPHAAGDGIESMAARAARTRRRALARRAAAARLRPGTPPPAPGRRHHPIQTEYYLEELFDKGVEMDVGVQTDLFVDRPATPIYVPAKTGADAATQIYPGDLFDFDLEVQPILEVLVGKTTEQALGEVAQEEELATLREQQRRYCELRDAELAERQRLAAHDLRLHQEKERRVAEARVAQVAAVEARERAAAAVLVQGYVAELLPSVLSGLRDQGYLMERIERGIDEEFMPWLVDEVSKEIESIITSRDVIIEIVRDVVEARAELFRAAGERDAERGEPDESVTPASLASEEHEEEPEE